jgi:hypothetical protein
MPHCVSYFFLPTLQQDLQLQRDDRRSKFRQSVTLTYAASALFRSLNSLRENTLEFLQQESL